MINQQRSARSVWTASLIALCLLAVIGLLVTADSGDIKGVLVAALSALALFLSLAIIMLRSSERGLRALRQHASDLSAGATDLSEPLPFAEQQAVAQAVHSLAESLRVRLELSRQERDQLAVLLEFGTEGLLQFNANGRIMHVNPAATKLLGLPADARGQSISTMIRNQELRELLLNAAQGVTVPPNEILVDDRQLFAICRPLPDGGGAVAAIIDLTAIRRLEAVRRDFVANVSHELKTPLTSIRGYTETMMAEDLPDDMRKQFLEVVQKNTIRLQRIVDDLLDLSRLQSGGWAPEIQHVDAGELAADVWAGCAESARAKRIDFDIVAQAGRPVAADPGGLRQVLSNLYDNAIRYTAPGGRIVVRVHDLSNGRRSSDTSDWVEIQVQDTGSGIPRDSLPRIFERFYRVDPARSRAEGGTGLGLSIVKHLIERMDGEVAAESELGKGTTIRVRLRAA